LLEARTLADARARAPLPTGAQGHGQGRAAQSLPARRRPSRPPAWRRAAEGAERSPAAVAHGCATRRARMQSLRRRALPARRPRHGRQQRRGGPWMQTQTPSGAAWSRQRGCRPGGGLPTGGLPSCQAPPAAPPVPAALRSPAGAPGGGQTGIRTAGPPGGAMLCCLAALCALQTLQGRGSPTRGRHGRGAPAPGSAPGRRSATGCRRCRRRRGPAGAGAPGRSSPRAGRMRVLRRRRPRSVLGMFRACPACVLPGESPVRPRIDLLGSPAGAVTLTWSRHALPGSRPGGRH